MTLRVRVTLAVMNEGGWHVEGEKSATVEQTAAADLTSPSCPRRCQHHVSVLDDTLIEVDDHIIGRGGSSIVRMGRLRVNDTHVASIHQRQAASPSASTSSSVDEIKAKCPPSTWSRDSMVVAVKSCSVDSMNGGCVSSSNGSHAASHNPCMSIALRRLKHEQHILSQLDHPGIVKLIGCMERDNERCSVLSFQPYGSLSDHIRHHGRRLLPRSRVRAYMSELVAIVVYMHSRGVRHRDITSKNIMVDGRGHMVLIDFGMAASSDDRSMNAFNSHQPPQPLTLPFAADEGCPSFLAPERARCEDIDSEEADWWSVGCIMHEMLLGVTPFTGDADTILHELRSMTANDEEIQLRTYPPINDADTINLPKQLLHPNPRRRLGQAELTKSAESERSPALTTSTSHSSNLPLHPILAHPYFTDIDWSMSREWWSKRSKIPFVKHIGAIDDEDDDDEEEEEDEGGKKKSEGVDERNQVSRKLNLLFDNFNLNG